MHRIIGVLLLVSAALLWPQPQAQARPWPPQEEPQLFQVVLPAAGREERTALAASGIAIDAIEGATVTTVVDAAGLERLLAQGVRPLSVAPLAFPPEDSAYHDYDEMMAELRSIAAARPEIVRLYSAGLSLEGRDIVAVKISDEPDLDDPTEPGVLFLSLTHAREHLTVEMALAIVDWFATGYGADAALTNLVQQREIFVLPNANPDGSEYDIRNGAYDYWRKNRRPNPDGTYGVDLNRNYGYRWGCCLGSSPYPYSELYRGPAAFSEPETQVVRDFVLAHPRITAAISFHTYSELILYPYGYTYDPLPPDMAPDDLAAFVSLADAMARTNGYTPQQSSALYISSGDTVDWLYGELGIFAFTFEMYPKSSSPGFYPPDEVIGPETRRNFAAVRLLAGAADNPRKVVGIGGDATAPEVELRVSSPDPWKAGVPVTLEAFAGDDRGVTLIALRVDGADLALEPAQAITRTWTAAEPGRHVFEALAFDAGANEGVSAPVSIAFGDPASSGGRNWLPMLLGR